MEGRESAGKERNTNRRRVGKEGILSLRLYYLALGSLVASRSLLAGYSGGQLPSGIRGTGPLVVPPAFINVPRSSSEGRRCGCRVGRGGGKGDGLGGGAVVVSLAGGLMSSLPS
jgi:hypothetical protein